MILREAQRTAGSAHEITERDGGEDREDRWHRSAKHRQPTMSFEMKKKTERL